MIREEIAKLIINSIKTLQKQGVFPDFEIPEIKVERPQEKIHGDYSSNIALVLAKKIKKNPLEIAEKINLSFKSRTPQLFGKTEVANPGFINFFISENHLQNQVKEILKLGQNFGKSKVGKGGKINIEFISANPTGPLTLGNGRGGFCGDVLANVLEKAGHKIVREYYINDRGEQIIKLGHSVLGDEQAIYKGDYIEELRKKTKDKDPVKIGEKAAKIILKELIKPTTKKMGIKFDVWFSEKSLYQKKETEKVLKFLKKKDLIYKKDKAIWFKSTQFGDDKDRVLIKENEEATYFLSDIAYLKNKFGRGFGKLIFFWGADHYGYINRLKGAVQALGYEKEQMDVIIMQLVKLFEKGKEVRMSKRTGVYVTLDELIDEVGLDAARFFFLARSPESHLNFDLDLAKKQSKENPVYYAQYANARIHSILAKSKIKKERIPPAGEQKSKINFNLLNHHSELRLIKQLIKFPEVVEDTAKDYQVQRLPQYAIDLADAFHKFYENCRVIDNNKNLSQARLVLVLAIGVVLKNTLDLMGISAPEKM